MNSELSEKDIALLQQLANGAATKTAALDTFVGIGTAKNRLTIIYRKLGAHDRTHAVAIAMRKGLIT